MSKQKDTIKKPSKGLQTAASYHGKLFCICCEISNKVLALETRMENLLEHGINRRSDCDLLISLYNKYCERANERELAMQRIEQLLKKEQLTMMDI